MNQDQINTLHEQIVTMDFKDIPQYIETLVMMGVEIKLVSAGTMRITFHIENQWFSVYSPSWRKHHGNIHSKPA